MFHLSSLFIYDMFNDAVYNSYCIVSNGMMINEEWIEKDEEGNTHGLSWSIIPAFAWRYWKEPRKTLG
jgi:hypothetical protein